MNRHQNAMEPLHIAVLFVSSRQLVCTGKCQKSQRTDVTATQIPRRPPRMAEIVPVVPPNPPFFRQETVRMFNLYFVGTYFFCDIYYHYGWHITSNFIIHMNFSSKISNRCLGSTQLFWRNDFLRLELYYSTPHWEVVDTRKSAINLFKKPHKINETAFFSYTFNILACMVKFWLELLDGTQP